MTSPLSGLYVRVAALLEFHLEVASQRRSLASLWPLLPGW